LDDLPMRLRSLALLAAAALVFTACAESGSRYGESGSNGRVGIMPSQAAGPQYRDNVRSLDGPQSVELAAGKTVVGRYTETPGIFVDYYAPDGRLVSLEPDGTIYRGIWKARYTQFCVQYDPPKPPHLLCFSFFEKDGRYSSFRPGGVGFYDIDSVTPGNVKNLPLE
jgi:hypothetical protein